MLLLSLLQVLSRHSKVLRLLNCRLLHESKVRLDWLKFWKRIISRLRLCASEANKVFDFSRLRRFWNGFELFFMRLFLFYFWLRNLFLRVNTILLHSFLNESVKLWSSVFVQPKRIVLHFFINKSLVYILICQKTLHFLTWHISTRFYKRRRQICLPVGVDEVVVHGYKGIKLTFRPEIQVYWFDLGDVCAESSVLTWWLVSRLSRNLPEQRRQTNTPNVIEAHLGVLLGQSAQQEFSGLFKIFSKVSICLFNAVSLSILFL